VQYRILPALLGLEGPDFYRIDRRWQPKDLIPDPYRRNLLKDAQERLNRLQEAEDELQTLERAPLYLRILKRMRLTVRRAQFAWRTDDLEFIKAVSEFFSDYGTVLQNLKIDQARGRFGEEPEPSK
jgi:hypothetical protein